MKKSLLLIALSAAFAGSVFAQAVAPSATPAATAKAAVTTTAAAPTAVAGSANAVCKDGTNFSGATLRGACKGHNGIDYKATKAAKAGTTGTAPVAAATAAPAKAAKATAAAGTATAAAPGGGADKVWVNDSSKVYHCQGDKYYGKTKKGEYMTETDAKAKGMHGDHGKACAAK